MNVVVDVDVVVYVNVDVDVVVVVYVNVDVDRIVDDDAQRPSCLTRPFGDLPGCFPGPRARASPQGGLSPWHPAEADNADVHVYASTFTATSTSTSTSTDRNEARPPESC
jgi:hypothetical protein